MFCPNCGSNVGDAGFCSNCGTNLSGDAPAQNPVKMKKADEVEFKIYGEDLQFVEVELDPGEAMVAEAGSMMYMDNAIVMDTIFGDGSGKEGNDIKSKLFSAGKRLVTGESLFMTSFTNASNSKSIVSFAAPYPGRVIPFDLSDFGGSLVCQKDSFLCAAKGISIGIALQKKVGVGLFGGEGFIMQKLEGDGLTFLHAGGMIHKKELQPGETIKLDTGCLVALSSSVNYDIQFASNIKNALFGGEGLALATLTGPGTVWLQSLPFSRMADRIFAASRYGTKKTEEGSVLGNLGGLGNFLGGNL